LNLGRFGYIGWVLLVALVASGCKSRNREELLREPGPPRGNLLQNPGFESGREGWLWKDHSRAWIDFSVVESQVHSGERSVRFSLDHPAGGRAKATQIAGVFQDLVVHPFPERVGGYFRVDEWSNDSKTTDLYLQVVVIVWGGQQLEKYNHQIRYYLAGTPEPAFEADNVKIEIISPKPPPLDRWVGFDLPIAQDFKRLWGAVPSEHEAVQVFFEARWDNLEPNTALKADVYFDDLFVEPQ
jgi:hypothetical protein